MALPAPGKYNMLLVQVAACKMRCIVTKLWLALCIGRMSWAPARQPNYSLFLALFLLKLCPQLVAKVLCEVLIIHVLCLLGADIVRHHLQQKLLEGQRPCCCSSVTTVAAAATSSPLFTPAQTPQASVQYTTTAGDMMLFCLHLLCRPAKPDAAGTWP
jgi:hypothetical protein